jgi:hypothetical protein
MNGSPAKDYDPREAPYLLGRYQGPTFIAHVPWTGAAGGQQVRVQPNIGLDKPCVGVHLILTGRITITVGAYVTVGVEALQNLLQEVLIEGTHRGPNIGRQTLQQLPGAWVFAWGRLFGTRGDSQYLAIGAGALTRAAELNVPIATPFTGAVNTFDFELHYDIPFAPRFPADMGSRDAQLQFALRPERWNDDSITLTLRFGDATSLGDPTGATVAFAGFGGGGTPDCEVQANYTIFGAADKDIPERVLVRVAREVPAGIIAAAAPRVELANLDKERTTNIVWKVGQSPAVASNPGIDTFSTLVDTLFENTQLYVGSTQYRKTTSTRNRAMKEYFGERFGTVLPQGYNGMTFVDQLRPQPYLRADDFQSGRFALVTDVLAALARAKAQVVQERVLIGDGPDRAFRWV